MDRMISLRFQDGSQLSMVGIPSSRDFGISFPYLHRLRAVIESEFALTVS